ncbi:AAA family ATPase [Chryseobacterium gambrini]|uniref:Recombinational DNA repair ATPase RecF n=1 Tax=Chryseobacterium gambrini TaxID=373672 RepID=A0A1N7NZ20_9FLAO|nr:AAA family ATPase [Chryseobacterium gambrini]SIT03572.1 Recombinational DNA repair ATPase RecF [Chryseobacterium gambrini]
MEKKITKIQLNNYKGYFGEYEPISLLKAENVLIYGENGSGKSSLYKAINNFFLSSRDNSVLFAKNKHNENEDGAITIEFSDYDVTNSKIIESSEINYQFSSTTSNHNVQFIQDAALTKGFLDYTDLLKIYFHDDPKPNLFELIVLIILGDHIPVSSGGNFKFKERWDKLQKDLIDYSYTRNDWTHRRAFNFLPIFETHLRSTLDEVFQKTNHYLDKYFIDFNIELEYTLLPLTFNYEDYKSDWFTTADLRLQVKKNGVTYENGYSDYLNEARLSAIAICMYLSTLSITNDNFDIKILYLDDVFIGLDSGNRIPILKILQDDFGDYQKFISTYDRHWYELAKRQFQIYNPDSWKFLEIYVGYDFDVNGMKINKPIINIGSDYYEKGTFYLHHDTKPDYPAAANYFRKALEELLSTSLPSCEIVDSDNTKIPEYKLGKFITICHNVLKKTGHDVTHINTINSHLYTLLHPLSHHETTTLVYKRELESIEHAFFKLKEQLRNIDYLTNYQCIQGGNSRLRIHFKISLADKHIQNYEFILQEPLLIFKKADGTLELIDCKCYITRLEGIKNGTFFFQKDVKKEDPHFQYKSFIEAVYKTYDHIINHEGLSFTRPIKAIDVIEYYNGKTWEALQNILIWK